jgi:SAM-dependent MidA family methyltransferase
MTWRAAMQDALYGGNGFYVRGERPAAHFRTSVHASSRYAAAMLALLGQADAALGHPPRLDLVDVGAGQGELLTQVLDLARRRPAERAGPRAGPPLSGRIAAHAAEVAPRPPGLDQRICWAQAPPDRITGLVIASEWLDNIPLDVAQLTGGGPRIVLVDPATGAQRTGPPASPPDLAWLGQWWPLHRPGDRAELGHPRCAAWAGVVGRLERGLALAADYGHCRDSRPPAGTLTGFRDGRPVRTIPDGSRDITAHVAMDACAAAGVAAGAAQTLLTTQREALRALGLTGRRPPLSRADSDPAGYLAELQRAGEEAELTDAAGLGGFGWLVQTVGIPLPDALAGLHPGHGPRTTAELTPWEPCRSAMPTRSPAGGRPAPRATRRRAPTWYSAWGMSTPRATACSGSG